MSISPKHALAVWRRNASMYGRTWKWNLLPNFFEPVFYLTAVGVGVGGGAAVRLYELTAPR